MAFRNPVLLNPAREIRDRIGGGEGYFGVHCRIGDGEFLRKKWENVEGIWRRVVRSLGVGESVMDEVWKEVGWEHGWRGGEERKRAVGWEEQESIWGEEDWDEDSLVGELLQQQRFQKRYSDTTWSPLSSLTCRGLLHTAPHLLAFNTPLYLATDSRLPLNDPTLVPFFSSFPCTFILSDFQFPSTTNQGKVVESVGELGRLVNVNDGIDLGRLLIPFLEAMIASMGRATVGTEHSTFSGWSLFLLSPTVC